MPFELYATGLERSVVEIASSFFDIYRDHQVDGPFVIMLAVYGARGAIVAGSGPRWSHRKPDRIDRELLVLPETVAGNADADPRRIMRETFDALWQSGGHPRSTASDEVGNWVPGR